MIKTQKILLIGLGLVSSAESIKIASSSFISGGGTNTMKGGAALGKVSFLQLKQQDEVKKSTFLDWIKSWFCCCGNESTKNETKIEINLVENKGKAQLNVKEVQPIAKEENKEEIVRLARQKAFFLKLRKNGEQERPQDQHLNMETISEDNELSDEDDEELQAETDKLRAEFNNLQKGVVKPCQKFGKDIQAEEKKTKDQINHQNRQIQAKNHQMHGIFHKSVVSEDMQNEFDNLSENSAS